MTARQVYEAVLIELNKVNAPTILLEDFNYLFNKAINLYINKKYNVYDVNQQSTDDLRVLKSSAILKPVRAKDTYQNAFGITNGNVYSASYTKDGSVFNSDDNDVTLLDSLYGATFEFDLPDDYLHMLNCTCIYLVKKTFKIYDANTFLLMPAKRLTSDGWSSVVSTIGWLRPSYRSPYYYIHHVNTSNENPYNEILLDDYGYLMKGVDSTSNNLVINTPSEEIPDNSDPGGIDPTTKTCYIYQSDTLPTDLSNAMRLYNEYNFTCKGHSLGPYTFNGAGCSKKYCIVISTKSNILYTRYLSNTLNMTKYVGYSDIVLKTNCFYIEGGHSGRITFS